MAHAKLNLRADHLIVSPINQHQAATHYFHREKISLPSKYWPLCLLALCFAGVLLKVELPMLMGFNPEWEHRVKSYISLLHIHAFFGSVALVIGGLQFLTLSKQWHRRLGRLYVVAILISAPLAVWIAVEHLPTNEAIAVSLQAAIWSMTTLVVAFHAIKAIHPRLQVHRIWILRSYALSCTFVLSRLLIDVFHLPWAKQFGDGSLFIWELTLAALLLAQWTDRAMQRRG